MPSTHIFFYKNQLRAFILHSFKLHVPKISPNLRLDVPIEDVLIKKMHAKAVLESHYELLETLRPTQRALAQR